MKRKKTVCEKYNCSECCNPIKVHSLSDFGKNVSFWQERKGVLFAPESNVETVKLRIYDCDNLDKKTGLCKDYKNRPEICRNSRCKALETKDQREQAKIIKEIKNQKFVEIKSPKIK